jgi:hypothetical protein
MILGIKILDCFLCPGLPGLNGSFVVLFDSFNVRRDRSDVVIDALLLLVLVRGETLLDLGKTRGVGR